MWQLFEEIWKERPHYSEISGEWLGKEVLSTHFHHILPKGVDRYEDGKFDKENIILLTADEHLLVEGDSTRFQEINKRREKLKEKYER